MYGFDALIEAYPCLLMLATVVSLVEIFSTQ